MQVRARYNEIAGDRVHYALVLGTMVSNALISTSFIQVYYRIYFCSDAVLQIQIQRGSFVTCLVPYATGLVTETSCACLAMVPSVLTAPVCLYHTDRSAVTRSKSLEAHVWIELGLYRNVTS